VLDIAYKGIYSEEALQAVPKYWLQRYFSRSEDGSYQVLKALKNEIIFRNFNLMTDIFPFKKKFHVIFCRNVMIYFEPKTKMQLVNKFYDSLEIGGYLFIGHSESIARDETNFKYIMPAVYRKG
jgi:chemotaxis protein methyltransferase CheR